MDRWRPSRRQLLALPAAVALALLAGVAIGIGPPYPQPVDDQAVYDRADLLSPDVEAALEARIDEIETRSGAELVVYTEHNTDITEDQNLENARALMDQWGVGRAGFDDGLVIMVAKDPDPGETRISLFGGAGFLGAYANEDALNTIIDSDLIPPARSGDWDSALLATVDALDARITPSATGWLGTLRTLNSLLGLVLAPIALVLTLGAAWWRWRREGDDPELIDSPSILMAGPPAEMTPPLATVVRQGKATQHSVNTALLDLARGGRISFLNLDRVASARSDSEPDPLLDPAILVHRDAGGEPLPVPQRKAWDAIRSLGGGDDRLSRQSLWRLNGELRDVQRSLEAEAVRLGWMTRLPTPSIGGSARIGIAEIVVGGLAVWLGFSIPMSGATLLGAALVVGGIGSLGFAQVMSQRTKAGAYVDAMLKAYRRTLAKTLEQARNMGEVVAEPTVRVLADTPDKAVVWGIALGLHDEVAEVLARGLADYRATGGTAGSAYYPVWLGSGGGSSGADAELAGSEGVVSGSGSIFSGSGLPDIGGMFNALGSIGSTPASSSSSSGGGGFGGGGSSGGGGASGSV
jgi:uncharacterized membrane protein YgcG